MIRNRSNPLTTSFVLAFAFLVLALGGLAPAGAQAGQVLEVDVAENGTRFSADETPAIPDGDFAGFPDYGGEFITEGYLYPAGFLDGRAGVNADGSAQFPEEVIGTWTCRGWHVGQGSATATGPIVATTQIFDFGDTPGAEMIVTDGFELADADVAIKRAITGGTGPFVKTRGESVQTLIGLNGLDDGLPFGVKLRVTFETN